MTASKALSSRGGRLSYKTKFWKEPPKRHQDPVLRVWLEIVFKTTWVKYGLLTKSEGKTGAIIGDGDRTRNGARLRSPSPIMASFLRVYGLRRSRGP